MLWVYQGSKYASGSEYSRFLNIQGFWIFKASEYTRVLNMLGLHSIWMHLIIHEYIWICLNMLEYVWICLNLSEWLLLYISPLSTWTLDYLFQHLHKTRSYSLKEHGTVFLKRPKSKISYLLLPVGVEGTGAVNLGISTIKSWTTTKHWNQKVEADSRTLPHQSS